MRNIERNTATCNFGSMYSIATDPWCSITKCDDFTSGLHELETYNQTNVSGPKHQNSFAGKDMMEILNHLTINFSAFETGNVRSVM